MGIGKLQEYDLPIEFVIRELCGAQFKRETPTAAGELEYRCPIKEGKTAYVIVGKNGIWKCFKNCIDCSPNSGGNILDFYMLYYNVKDRSEAYRGIRKAMGEVPDTVKKIEQEAFIHVKLQHGRSGKKRQSL